MILRMLGNWAQLERSQWWSREALVKKQNRKLVEIVRYAYQNVPFYRRLYDSAQVDPTGITGYKEINRLPIVTRQLLRDTPLQDRTAANTDASKCMPNSTSGSTGPPVTVLDDPRFAADQKIAYLRALMAGGVKPWRRICRVGIMTSANRPLLAHKLGLWNAIEDRFLKRVWGTDDIHDHMKFYSAWKPEILIAAPSYFKALLWFSEKEDVDLSFKVLFTNGGELLDDTTRKHVRDKFQADVIDHYALTEAGILSWECPAHCGYHINVESVLMEFIQDEEPVAAGEPGKVYVTSLDRRPTPIIRYFSGDVATPSDDECPCGRGLPLMKNIQGRIMDFVLTDDGKYLSPYVIILGLINIRGVENFKLTQKSDSSIDVQLRTSMERKDEVLRAVHLCCRELFGDTPLSVRLVDEIQGEHGPKFRPVESHFTGT
jgi:phenylacetate-CoA ligase